MTAWGWWLVAAGLFAAAEIATLTLVLGMLSVASLVGLLAERLGAGVAAQILWALASSIPLLFLLRPFAQRYIHRNTPELVTGMGGYVGRTAKVTVAIAPGSPGQISVHGELWPASAAATLTVGASVVIDTVEGSGFTVRAA